MNTNEKIQALREKMREELIDCYYVPTDDPHMSEYVAPAFQARAWLSGFDGSAGTAIVTAEDAKLWADGRYYIQAAKQIDGSEFELMKLGTPGVPSPIDYLLKTLPKKGIVAANGWTISQASVENIQAKLKDGQGLRLDLSLVENIWSDRPQLPMSEAFHLDEHYSGLSTEEKLRQLREYLAKENCDYALFGKLDDIAWLYNVRGGDVKSTPVLLSYALVSQEEAVFFVDPAKVSDALRVQMEVEGITLRPYEAVTKALAEISRKTITLDKRFINATVFAAIPENNTVVNQKDWTSFEKAKKNATEIKNLKEAYRKDGIAVTKLIYWLKNHKDIASSDELEASLKLLSFREELEHFIEESFTTISAYGPNGAMMHYGPTEQNKASLAAKGFLLVDSGGQYLEGTTDTTRTIVLGELSEEERKDYTLCLKAHINLARAIFLEGATGYYLDALARQPLWQHRMDYKSGTGHGVGYLLSVHEGPHSVSRAAFNQEKLVPGMVVTNEPGVYKEGKHGIRLENTYVVVEDEKVDTDQFFRFENFTRVPFDRDALDLALLSKEEIEWINDFHQLVLADLKGYLSEEEAKWLEEECRALEV